MIRGFAVFLGLWLGLCVAVLFGGTLAHLRMTGLSLPDWVAGVADDARFTEGRGTLNGAALHWRLSGWSGFDVTLTGPDWQAQGRAEPEGTALRITQIAGIVPLGYLDAGAGDLALEGGEMLVGLDGTLRDGQLEGQARGSDPAGPVTLIWEDGWRLASR